MKTRKLEIEGRFIMRGFNEIREVKDNFETRKKVEDREEFKKIKPETNITIEETKKFWDSMFA